MRIETKLGGRFRLTVLKESGEAVTELEFPNLVTNNGLDLWASWDRASLPQSLSVGSGTAEPSFADTELQSLTASTVTKNTTDEGFAAGPPAFVYARVVFQFPSGAAAGNISEIGAGESPTSLFSRALLLDAEGEPTSITVLSDEILRVEYEIRMYIPEGDSTGAFTLTGSAGGDYTYVARPADIEDRSSWRVQQRGDYTGPNPAWYCLYSGDISSVTGRPGGSRREPARNAMVVQPYVKGSYERKGTVSWLTTNGNGTSKSAMFSIGGATYQFQITPPIVKNDRQTLSLDFVTSWGRYDPEDED